MKGRGLKAVFVFGFLCISTLIAAQTPKIVNVTTLVEYTDLQAALDGINSGETIELSAGEYFPGEVTKDVTVITSRFYLSNKDDVSIVGSGYNDTIITNLTIENCSNAKVEKIQFRGGKTVNNQEGYSYPHSGLIVKGSEGFTLANSAIIESGALTIIGGGNHLLARNIISNYDYCLNLSVLDVKIFHNTVYASKEYGAFDAKYANSKGGFFINATNSGLVEIKNNLIYSGSKWTNTNGEWSEVAEPLSINVNTLNVEGNVFADFDGEIPASGVVEGWTLANEKAKNLYIKDPESVDLRDNGVVIPGYTDFVTIIGEPDVGPVEFALDQKFVKANGRDLYLNGEKFNFKGIAFTNYYYADEVLDTVGKFTNLKHHKQEDFDHVKSMGFNTIRFALNGDWFRDNVTDNSDEIWTWLDESVQMASNANLLLLIEMHIPPGESWLSDDNIFDTQGERWIWNSEEKQNKLIAIWTEIARRYSDNPAVGGYGLLNEPKTSDGTGEQWFGSNNGQNDDGLCDRLIQAVRSVDANHLILIDGYVGALTDDAVPSTWQKKFNDDNLMYDLHFYFPGGYSHKGALWGGGQDNGSWYPDEYMVHNESYLYYNEAEYDLTAKSTDQTYVLNQWKTYETTVVDGGKIGKLAPLFEVNAKRNSIIQSEILFDNMVLLERKKGTETWDLADSNVKKIRECRVEGWWVNEEKLEKGTSDGFFFYDWHKDPNAAEFIIANEGNGDDISYGFKNINGGDFEHQAVDWGQSWITNIKPKADCEYKFLVDVKIKNAELGENCNYFGPVINVYKGGDFDAEGNYVSNNSGYIPKDWYGMDKNYLNTALNDYIVTAVGEEYNVPVSVFEFGLMKACFEDMATGGNYGGSLWMQDLMNLYKENNVSWAFWAYRNAPMGIYHEESWDVYLDPSDDLLKNDLIYKTIEDSFKQNETRKVKEIVIDNSVGLYDINRVPSQEPPVKLAPEQCPQFIIFGYDDNQFDDGMYNILDIYKGITNPTGKGNPGTYDGTPAKASFYLTPGGRDLQKGYDWEVGSDTVTSWKAAYDQGHEIGNHTWYHEHGLQFSVERWKDEMAKCNDFLISKLGMDRSEITGFRTPFLEYNPNTFIALKELGFEYDNSFEGGWRYYPAEDGSTLYWPYTMDSGKPEGSEAKDFGIAPGLWQMPTDCTFYDGGTQVARTTGFDYNVWFSAEATKAKFLEMLKFSLEKKYNGNRSPMNFGMHTNYYSDKAMDEMKIYDPKSVAKLKSTVIERTEAVKEFLEYAVTLPDVRIVTTQQALNWVKKPVPLGPQVIKHNLMVTNGLNGAVSPSGFVRATEGENFNILLEPEAGYKVDTVTVNGAPIAITGNVATLTNVQEAAAVNVTFIEDPDAIIYTINAVAGANGTVTPVSKRVNKGQRAIFEVTADADYTLDSASIGSETVEVVDGFIEVSNVQDDLTLNVTFKRIEVTADYTVTSDWGANFGGEIIITNTSLAPIPGWEVTLTYSGNQTISGWNGVFSQTDNVVTITNPGWSGPLAPGASVKLGFNGSYTGKNSDPEVTVVKK